MRGIYTPVTKIRRQVFKKVAEMAYKGDFERVDELPYEIIEGEVASYRESVFKERAIVAERIRLACGLNVHTAAEHAPISKGFQRAISTERVFEEPLVNVITFACNACPTTAYEVSDNCRGCLAHPCTSACPTKAISIVDGRSVIDKEKCVKCGRCSESCPYNAIVKYDRPCAAACGVNAIESDELGRAKINHEKCVSCGQCLVHCPFAAIADKSQILQLKMCIRDRVKGAPLLVTKNHLAAGKVRAVIINSGNANTCNPDGEEKAEMMCRLAAEELGADPQEVLVASTGVIGEVLPIEPIAKACPSLVKGLSSKGNIEACQAILTTDTRKKEVAVTFSLNGNPCTVGGMAKGSGMIHPNMATMLCFMTTDAAIEPKLMQIALSAVTRDTFNMVSVDGDTSTNDMALLLASGKAGNPVIENPDSQEYQLFLNGLYAVMMNLSRMIAGDGEGATKLLQCTVSGARCV